MMSYLIEMQAICENCGCDLDGETAFVDAHGEYYLCEVCVEEERGMKESKKLQLKVIPAESDELPPSKT